MTKFLLKLVLMLFLLLSLLSCSVVTTLKFTDKDIASSPNLVLNGDFNPYSTIAAEALKGWSVHLDPPDSQTSPVVIDPHQALEGKTSLRIDASDKDVLILSDSFNVRRYGGYYLRSNVKSNSSLPPQVQLRFIVFKESGKIINRFRCKIKPGEEWEQSTISAGFIRPGAKFGRLAIHIPPFKDGSVWIDNAGCYEVHGFKID